ncbi:homoprotocatechuate degradation operon regulator HpaR [Breoghania sp.]|nr:homoprotocatechuate degradation operon regulator HpaR [Breoghania sp.]
MQLMSAREEVMLRFRPYLHAHGLTDQQWRIIRALAEVEHREILDLSDVCGIHPASLSRILPKLDSAGIINRRPNKADQRRVIVTLAAKGRALYNRIAPESERLYNDITSDIGPDLVREAYDVLERMIEALRTKRVSAAAGE